MVKFGRHFTPTGLKPEILVVIPVVAAMAERFHKEITLSSGIDRTHGAKSLHYVGLSLDFMWKGFNGEVEESNERQFAEQLARRLGPLYDVVLHTTHVHIEYQPKEALDAHWRS